MVSRIGPMKIERGEFANEMVRSFPYLNMCAVCHSNIPAWKLVNGEIRLDEHDTYSPSGENCISLMGL